MRNDGECIRLGLPYRSLTTCREPTSRASGSTDKVVRLEGWNSGTTIIVGWCYINNILSEGCRIS
jgi:hypothetical protein